MECERRGHHFDGLATGQGSEASMGHLRELKTMLYLMAIASRHNPVTSGETGRRLQRPITPTGD